RRVEASVAARARHTDEEAGDVAVRILDGLLANADHAGRLGVVGAVVEEARRRGALEAAGLVDQAPVVEARRARRRQRSIESEVQMQHIRSQNAKELLATKCRIEPGLFTRLLCSGERLVIGGFGGWIAGTADGEREYA